MDTMKTHLNKKVLLRERKRHTDRGVSSTPSVILYEVGYPPPIGVPPGKVRWGVPKVGYPHRGTPQPGLTGGGGTPRLGPNGGGGT